jgi:hypothetical protein
MIISGTNGIPNANYYVLAAADLSLPFSQWATIATNTFDAAGAFTFTASVGLPQQFFFLQLP